MPAGALGLEVVLITFSPILPSLDAYKAPVLRSIQIYIYLDILVSNYSGVAKTQEIPGSFD